MTIKQTTPVAAAMGVFAFLGKSIFRRFPATKLLKTVRAISLWVGMPRADVHRGSPNHRSRPRSISPASHPPLSLHAPLRDLRGRRRNRLSWLTLRPSRSLRSSPRPARDDGKIRASFGQAGALHDVECRNRTAKTL